MTKRFIILIGGILAFIFAPYYSGIIVLRLIDGEWSHDTVETTTVWLAGFLFLSIILIAVTLLIRAIDFVKGN